MAIEQSEKSRLCAMWDASICCAALGVSEEQKVMKNRNKPIFWQNAFIKDKWN